MATLAERMAALRGQRVEGYSGATVDSFVIGSTTDKQEREAAERAARRKAARALARGAGVRNASALPTSEADKLAVDALATVSSGGVDQQAKPGGDGGELVLADQPEPRRGGNPAFQKGKPNPYYADRVEPTQTIAATVEISTVSESRHIVQNQLVAVARGMQDVPDALSFVSKVVRGRVKVSPTVRLGACYDLLNRCGITHDAAERLEKLQAAPGGGVDLANLAGSLARAAELANRRKQAETVSITGQKSGNAQGDAA